MANATEAALPADFAKGLTANPHAGAVFRALPPSHQREYLSWVEEAKRPDTRIRRIAGMIERLLKAGE